jgi:predicted transcriptional regulator of viral defense system
MGNKNKLFEIADQQLGFFTAKQAVKCGYSRPNFHLNLTSEEWTQEARGVYRLARYPVTNRPELVLWYLWSRNQKDIPQGVWSHETALDIHELSDVMSSKMHLTVPLNFRRRIEIPKILYLHHENLKVSDIEIRQGYKVTTPIKTIIDVINSSTVADNFIIQATHQALERGLILKNELNNLKNTHLNTYKKLVGLLKW